MMNAFKKWVLAHLMLILFLLSGCASVPPNRAVMAITEADSAYQQGLFDIAEQKYHEAINAVPEDAYAYFRLGNLYTKKENYDGAITAYRAALIYDSRHAKAYNNLATVYLILAEQTLTTALQELPPTDENLQRLLDHHYKMSELLYLSDQSSPADK